MVLSSLFISFTGKKSKITEWKHSNLVRVSYNTLSKATNGFSSANLVGVGGYGSVYKVVLGMPSNGAQIFAVKVFNMLRQGASNSFTAECEMFRNIWHRNIVKIVTTCSSVDFCGNDFKALVYEFMENGSLEEWLHPTFGTQNSPDKSLNLLQRLDIAIGVACALDYLHNQCETPVVHCDLKPSNVLLDRKLVGHVSDFGLARFLPKTNNVSANQTSSRSVSYVAPEYKKGSAASTYGDVYCFGILLLEMFTGKKPSDNMFRDDLNLHTFVKMALFDRVIEIADSRLFLQEDSNATICCPRLSEIEECGLSLIFAIGVVCSSKSPRHRMDMGYVVTQLQSIKNILKESKVEMQKISEATVIRDRLIYALRRGFKDVLVEGDSKLLIDAVNGGTQPSWRLQQIIQEIKKIAEDFNTITFSHVCREAGFVADAVAIHWTSEQWRETVGEQVS